MTDKRRKVVTLLHVNETAFGDRPDFDFRGPLLMSEEDFKEMGLWCIGLSECRAIAKSLEPPVCLFERTLRFSPIAPDDARSCATTPARPNADSGCKICGKPTCSGFKLCTQCHFQQLLKPESHHSEESTTSTAHICWKCKEHASPSLHRMCSACTLKASGSKSSEESTTSTAHICWKCKEHASPSLHRMCRVCTLKASSS